MPRSECEEKCARLKAELEEMKQEKNVEIRNLRDELKKMEDRKEYYKNNFSQAEDRANDEEQEYRAEAEAFEKLRNEYNTNVVEFENLEKDKAKSSVSQREAEKITLQSWPKTTETFILEGKCHSWSLCCKRRPQLRWLESMVGSLSCRSTRHGDTSLGSRY